MSRVNPKILSFIQLIKDEIEISIPVSTKNFYQESINLENDIIELREGHTGSRSLNYRDYPPTEHYTMKDRIEYIGEVLNFCSPDNSDEIYEVTFNNLDDEQKKILNKIQRESDAIKIIQDIIVVVPNRFNELYHNINNKTNEIDNNIDIIINKDNDTIFWLSYKNHKLLLNDYLLIATCQLVSINDRMLTFLMDDKNQNRLIERTELEKFGILKLNNNDNIESNRSPNGKETKSFYQFLDDVNIRDNFRTLFVLEISTHAINFRGKITKKDLEEAKIGHIELRKLFKPDKNQQDFSKKE